jgi:3-hydroxybutyryl-CoA dehydrogenase
MSRLAHTTVLVAGAGIMGTGIAQVAAQAGHPVLLFDLREGAAAEALARLESTLQGLAARGKLPADAAQAALARLRPVATLEAAAGAGLVVEAIAEQLDAKRQLFRQLEDIVAADAVLATNTSSISITAIAGGLRHPGRVVGMHFFNPVPLMRLVEVVSGLHTEPAVAQAIHDLALAWGKVPQHARSTPGFIVNRIARPYYAEALALLQEQAATPAVLDACLRGAGFRMGPCELMDLIGHDTNFAVTHSVYAANFFDKRYAPSLLQRDLVDGGWLGRKSGRGFYTYTGPGWEAPDPQVPPPAPLAPVHEVTVHGPGAMADALEHSAVPVLQPQGLRPQRERGSGWTGLQVDGARLVMTGGPPAYELAARTGVADIAVFDRPAGLTAAAGGALAYAVHAGAASAWREQAPAWLHALGFTPLPVADAPGLVVARTLAMLINEAADAVLQGVCTPAGADCAMKLGVNYPAGPFEWLHGWSTAGVIGVIEALDAAYRGERYRVSPWLRRGGGM